MRGKGLLAKVVYACALYPTFVKQDRIFLRFLRKHLNTLPGRTTTQEDFARLPLTSDVYVTGSDQTWNSAWNDGISRELFLDFVPDCIKKIAYAASMGKGELDESEKEETRQLLERYHAISVRESTAVEICNGLGIKNAIQVLDPTLQMTRDYWMQYARQPKEQGYVLIYQLNTNPQFDRYAQEFAQRKGLKLLRFCNRYDQIIKCGKALVIPEVTDFISYVAYADCVITDSFHATAFCINLNTPFISIYPHDFSSRLASILELTGLQHRHLTSYDDFSFVDNTSIDFTYANKILDAERQKATEWMRKALED